MCLSVSQQIWGKRKLGQLLFSRSHTWYPSRMPFSHDTVSSQLKPWKITTVTYVSLCCRFCGIRNPSWRELSHFVEFLYLQLKSSEQSVFCNCGLSGMKSFVIKFMIRMSRVRPKLVRFSKVKDISWNYSLCATGFCYLLFERGSCPGRGWGGSPEVSRGTTNLPHCW